LAFGIGDLNRDASYPFKGSNLTPALEASSLATLDTRPENAPILNSWKEIAQYVGRGLRTVQRWERDLAFPVRRPRGKSRSAVIGIREEIDEWIASRPRIATDNNGFRRAKHSWPAASDVRETIAKSRLLWHESRQRRRELSLALHALVGNLQELQDRITTLPIPSKPSHTALLQAYGEDSPRKSDPRLNV
jgi:predicted DNA-binding transcriptional regulator AlpA